MELSNGRHRNGRRRVKRRLDLAILLCAVIGVLLLTLPSLTSCNAQGSPPASPSISQITAPQTSPPFAATPTATPEASSPAAELPPSASEVPPAPEAPPPAPAVLPAAAAPVRISYPAAGVDVAVHPLEPDAQASASRTLNPPATLDGYWLTPYGLPGAGSSDTTYVIGHSWIDRDAPFNRLSTRASVGDVLDVFTHTGIVQYRVDRIDTYNKDTLKDSPIWNVVPGQLVLISCYTEDPWGTNVTVTATPVLH